MRVISLHFVSKENWSLCADLLWSSVPKTRHICLGAKWARRACTVHWDWGGSRPPGKGRMAPPLGRKPVVAVTILLHPSWHPSFFFRVQSFSGLPLTPVRLSLYTWVECIFTLAGTAGNRPRTAPSRGQNESWSLHVDSSSFSFNFFTVFHTNWKKHISLSAYSVATSYKLQHVVFSLPFILDVNFPWLLR